MIVNTPAPQDEAEDASHFQTEVGDDLINYRLEFDMRNFIE